HAPASGAAPRLGAAGHPGVGAGAAAVLDAAWQPDYLGLRPAAAARRARRVAPAERAARAGAGQGAVAGLDRGGGGQPPGHAEGPARDVSRSVAQRGRRARPGAERGRAGAARGAGGALAVRRGARAVAWAARAARAADRRGPLNGAGLSWLLSRRRERRA